ncbi:hypothetical protein C5167_033630 [Papaver somniferum]|uniref:Uncharacterized protein n=1 Tax=Papaver somniferum TaxID=3469 RepID=A0A4Y7KEQ2_PAPSO|nr:hypothetical protein C5167_033630 [Papaver somniferum]
MMECKVDKREKIYGQFLLGKPFGAFTECFSVGLAEINSKFKAAKFTLCKDWEGIYI